MHKKQHQRFPVEQSFGRGKIQEAVEGSRWGPEGLYSLDQRTVYTVHQ